MYIHKVGRNQEAFIATYAHEVLPKLKWKPTHEASTVASIIATAKGLQIIARTGRG
jgi:hypothetical protein